MKKLEVFENEIYRRIGGSPLSSADKRKVNEICALYDKELIALQEELDEFGFFNMGFLLGRKNMELQILGFEPCDTNPDDSSILQRIDENYNRGLRVGLHKTRTNKRSTPFIGSK